MPILLPQRLESDTGKRVFANPVKEDLTEDWQRKAASAENSCLLVVEQFGGYQTVCTRTAITRQSLLA
jgi:hypothetical protein